MLEITHNIKDETLQFESSKELKEFLKLQNPSQLRLYARKLNIIKPDIEITEFGEMLRIRKKTR